jgi:rod shape determining protein RodA
VNLRNFSALKHRLILIVSVTFLLVVGTLIQFSLSASDRSGLIASPASHVISILVGLAALGIAYWTPFSFWVKFSKAAYVALIVLLMLVLQFGPVVFGAKRWLVLGGLQFQPSEFMKVAVLLIGSMIVSRLNVGHKNLKLLGITAVTMAIPVGLILVQPDIGTAMVIVAMWSVMVSVSALSQQHLIVMFAIVIALIGSGLPLLSPYQRTRITSFIGGHSADDASSYNVVQARIAIGSGGIKGQGLGGGTQSQLSFLPARHTDFAFAVVAEKLGIMGALAVVAAEIAIAWRAWQIVSKSVASIQSYAMTGTATLFSVQTIVNISMNLGLLPVTGITLPFVSYGGSSMVVCLFLIGWLLRAEKTSLKTGVFTA